jgi:short-subunit dehydrogenase
MLMPREHLGCGCTAISQLICRCLVARRKDTLEEVRQECIALGLSEQKILVVPADVTSADDLLKVRDEVIAGERLTNCNRHVIT